MYAFWLVLTYGLLEDRRIDDVIIKPFFNYLLYKTNRFQVVMRLFRNRSQMTSKCGKNISDRLSCTSCATFFSYHILMSSVIYYWTDAQQLGIYLLTRSYPYFSGSLLFFRGFLSSFYILQAQFSDSFGWCCLRYSLDLISAWKYEKLNLRLCTTIKRALVPVFLFLSC